MANKYSDFINVRNTKSVFSIIEDSGSEWMNFIPNEQFNDVLYTVIKSVSKKSIDQHKSFWLEGTYGNGKSHASAVIMHLLCDPIEDIMEYINQEYSNPKYAILREMLLELRSKIQLFPVKMEGRCSISNPNDLAVQIQIHVIEALKKANINISIKTDFDNYIANIEKNPDLWDVFINDSRILTYANNRERLIQLLNVHDATILETIKQVQSDHNLTIHLESSKLKDWFFDVQDALAESTCYSGIFLVWDEFTVIPRSAIGQELLSELQALAEATMDEKNNSYFFHIAHPSALDKYSMQSRIWTMGRYHWMKYNMEPVSAFKIMSRKFVHSLDTTTDSYRAYHEITNKYFAQMNDVYLKYSSYSNSPDETLDDLKSLFPLHPGTAILATYFARVAGSSSRSVFEFLGDNDAIRDFLDNEEHFVNSDMITADYLWDYVHGEFEKDVTKYGIVIEKYNFYNKIVKNESSEHLKVFKTILLLNALNNIANSDNVIPSEENIRNMYSGTPLDDNLTTILDWINNEGIIQRSPQGIFEVRFSALDTKKLDDAKNELITSTYKFTYQILRGNNICKKEFDNMVGGIFHPKMYNFYSEDINESVLLKKIENEL